MNFSRRNLAGIANHKWSIKWPIRASHVTVRDCGFPRANVKGSAGSCFGVNGITSKNQNGCYHLCDYRHKLKEPHYANVNMVGLWSERRVGFSKESGQKVAHCSSRENWFKTKQPVMFVSGQWRHSMSRGWDGVRRSRFSGKETDVGLTQWAELLEVSS